MDKDINLEELKRTIYMVKNNKAPGPDLCIIELFKWLNDAPFEKIRSILNTCWNLEKEYKTPGELQAHFIIQPHL